jgi:ectoine hydroxylase-related dioxygenase (phytanoyl-CoA dioxygenase family)
MESAEFLVSNDALNDSEELRRRANRDGYLFFRGLLDAEPLLNVRRQILELCQKEGWLASGCSMMDGIAKPGVKWVEPQPEFMRVYYEIMKLEEFHALAHHPALLDLYRKLFGEEVLVHARNIARIIFPDNTKFTTPSHQDWVHIQGTQETYSAWIPLSDCPRELGGLAILVGSHKAGLMQHHEAYGAGGIGIDTDRLSYKWASSEFRLGDFVTFQSMTIHKGLHNVTKDRIRLSVDFRYQGASRPVVEGSIKPHYGTQTWEEIYKGWTSTRYQYYWTKYDLNLVPFDDSYFAHEKSRKT